MQRAYKMYPSWINGKYDYVYFIESKLDNKREVRTKSNYSIWSRDKVYFKQSTYKNTIREIINCLGYYYLEKK